MLLEFFLLSKSKFVLIGWSISDNNEFVPPSPVDGRILCPLDFKFYGTVVHQ